MLALPLKNIPQGLSSISLSYSLEIPVGQKAEFCCMIWCMRVWKLTCGGEEILVMVLIELRMELREVKIEKDEGECLCLFLDTKARDWRC